MRQRGWGAARPFWLAQGLKGGFAKFWQLVQKEHAPVGKAHLAGAGVSAAAHKGNIRNGVVWRAEGPHTDKPGFGR